MKEQKLDKIIHWSNREIPGRSIVVYTKGAKTVVIHYTESSSSSVAEDIILQGLNKIRPGYHRIIAGVYGKGYSYNEINKIMEEI